MGTFTMRMDDEFKKEFSEACKELGCNISTVVTMLGTKMIRERRIPFEVCSDPFYSEANMAHLKRSIAQLEAYGERIHQSCVSEGCCR